jgi:hypothetical protein
VAVRDRPQSGGRVSGDKNKAQNTTLRTIT